MAVTTLTATALSFNTGQVISQGAGTAINTANSMRVLYPREGKLLIFIDSDHASTSATFTAGSFIASGKGTVAHAVGNTVMEVIVVESDRLKNNDGYVAWTWATDSAGYVNCFTLPNG